MRLQDTVTFHLLELCVLQTQKHITICRSMCVSYIVTFHHWPVLNKRQIAVASSQVRCMPRVWGKQILVSWLALGPDHQRLLKMLNKLNQTYDVP